MKRTPVDQIEAGAVLGADVLDDSGNVLLGKGTKLTERHKGMLERRGIEQVMTMDSASAAVEEVKELAAETVSSSEASGETAGPSPAVLARLERIETIFSDAMDDPLMRELYQIAVKHTARGEVCD